MEILKVKKLDKRAIIPSKRDNDAGYDLYGIFDEDLVKLNPGDIKIISTGLALEFSNDYFLSIRERSSTGKLGISIKGGVVDSSYRGEIKLIINNTSNKTLIFYKDEETLNKFKENHKDLERYNFYPQSKAIAQGVLIKISNPVVIEVGNLSETERSNKMFGSTNK